MAVSKTITWETVQKSALQKMYSYTSDAALTDALNEEYMYAMPSAATEAIALLWGDVKTKGEITFSEEEFGEANQIDLFEQIPDLYSTAGMTMYTYDDDGALYQMTDFSVVGGRWLTVDDWNSSLIVNYMEKPEIITSSTLDSYVMQCGDTRAIMLPLYIASQLYKDDDISIATTYRNEFEEARASLGNVPGGASVNTDDCLWWDI